MRIYEKCMKMQYPRVLIHNTIQKTIQNTCKYKKIHENTIKIHYNTCIFYIIIDITLGCSKKRGYTSLSYVRTARDERERVLGVNTPHAREVTPHRVEGLRAWGNVGAFFFEHPALIYSVGNS